jgi:hypothetical protein
VALEEILSPPFFRVGIFDQEHLEGVGLSERQMLSLSVSAGQFVTLTLMETGENQKVEVWKSRECGLVDYVLIGQITAIEFGCQVDDEVRITTAVVEKNEVLFFGVNIQ